MGEWISGLPASDKVFFLAALVGGVFFAVWLVLQFLGGDGHSDLDTDLDVSGQADVSFKVLSFQGMSAFLTLFGLVGLGINRETEAGTLAALVGGAAAGSAMTWVTGRLFRFFRDLQSSGTRDLTGAVGAEGTVYLKIPSGGVGKVNVTVNDHMQVVEATSVAQDTLETGCRVKVVRVVDGSTLVVEPIA